MYVAIDFGSTNTRVASSLDLVTFDKVHKFKTSTDLDSQIELISYALAKVTGGEEISFIGLGIHGMIDKKKGIYVKMPNYPALDNKEFGVLFPHLPLERVFIENDAVVAALAEAKLGNGQEFSRCAYVTVSSGIGGALVVNGKIPKDVTYEPGHIIITKDGQMNKSSGVPGDFEAYASGFFFETNYGVKPEDCEDQDIWKDYASHLAVGLHNVIQLWCPDGLVLGGGVGYNCFENLVSYLQDDLKKIQFVELPKIVKSKFGDDVGLYGALSIIKRSERNISSVV